MKRMLSLETHDMPAAWLAAAKTGAPQVGPGVSAPRPLVGAEGGARPVARPRQGKGWGAARNPVGSPNTLGAYGQKCRFPRRFSPLPPTPIPSPRGGGEHGASVQVTKRRRLAAGPSPVSSLALATLIPVPAIAQGTETTQTLFTPTVILIGIAGLVIGGVIGFIRRRKEMKK